ncbi:MBL fold metallo-hydrolase [Geomonas nitrogeniifigens]|uniref:MBL fold metallo-hydrolase n=1 Tax=Geomonas diazotrophica TaxID=2843197 RepID=UPI001C2C5A55|nr:MBL fold metallo-hydrolase [Geomonas nitrogeniifigens]QXE88418.1 MBL fold metallo-hydrolase [Geomonas nitrogeniifigens]
MKFMQVRNATARIEYGGKCFLIDPVLAEKGAYPAFAGTVNAHLRNPLVDLPVPVETLLDVDAVIVTHTHLDHWDEAAKNRIPKGMPIFAQNENDAVTLREAGFSDVTVLTGQTRFAGITLIKTSGQHGSDDAMAKLGDRLGEVCGVVLQHPDEKALYLAGDTVWNRNVADALREYTPGVIVLNCGDAQIIGIGSIIMGKRDVHDVWKAAPGATIIASHMEAMNHAVLSRKELRDFLKENGMIQRVLVPEDGESCVL